MARVSENVLPTSLRCSVMSTATAQQLCHSLGVVHQLPSHQFALSQAGRRIAMDEVVAALSVRRHFAIVCGPTHFYWRRKTSKVKLNLPTRHTKWSEICAPACVAFVVYSDCPTTPGKPPSLEATSCASVMWSSGEREVEVAVMRAS